MQRFCIMMAALLRAALDWFRAMSTVPAATK
jgi:hypothetical protein